MKHSSINWCLSLQHSVQFPMLRGCPKSGILYVIWELFVVWNWHGVDHKGLADTAQSSSSHHHTPNEGYETLNDQRVSLLAAHHPIYCAERVPNIWYFVWNLRLVVSKKATVWNGRYFDDTIRSSFNQPYRCNEGFETLNHQWVSLLAAQHPISSAERVRKIWYFTWNSGLVFSRNHTVWTIRGLCMLFEALSSIVLYLTKDITHSSTNGWHSLQHSIPFLVLRGCPKSDILYEIWD